MKTTITIRGQINGNFRLLNAIKTYECIKKDIGFNNYALIFPTKKAAKKAMWEGFKYLKRNEPEYVRMENYSRFGSINYDASRAEIKENYND